MTLLDIIVTVWKVSIEFYICTVTDKYEWYKIIWGEKKVGLKTRKYGLIVFWGAIQLWLDIPGEVDEEVVNQLKFKNPFGYGG